MLTRNYAGFWVRVAASAIDTVILLALTGPFLFPIALKRLHGAGLDTVNDQVTDILFGYVLPAVAVVAFWLWKSATPGKMVFRLRVLDAVSGRPMSKTQSVIRYLGYFLSTIPLGIGLIWVGIDPRKQGWHDKLARTIVIQDPKG